MIAAQAVLTSRGGKTSHAAVVARGMGKVCVCGADALVIDSAARQFTTPATLDRRGTSCPKPHPLARLRRRGVRRSAQ
ncbi:hypothetical protein GCM10023097_18250 [Streptomyces collinus]|uniref:Phosphoenolpyruvate synthase/pyruvate phosphate dikinase n=1 Tax=Streptomyces collinus TaxID=42684 RepID=A0AA89TKQ9_STRCU|nr:phosphoenolpyruvate synthase/pyruvate phosphate dikinase [Streptomyces collinus]